MLRALPHYIIIRISKAEQRERREKMGSLFVAPVFTFMTRELQCGEIVSVGEVCAREFPACKVGSMAIVHHFVTGKEMEASSDHSKYLIDSDETYKYYSVTASEFNGRQVETYGIWDGEKIIPHPDYIFLQVEKKETSGEDFTTEATKKVGSLFVFEQWKESRELREQRLKNLQDQVQELTKGGMTPKVKQAIENKEAEMTSISKKLNKKAYTPYIVEAINDELGFGVGPGDEIYMFNQACQTTITFRGKDYIVAKSSYAGAISQKPSLSAMH